MLHEPLSSGVMVLAYALMILGLIGAVLPVLPGSLLIWLGILVWAWADGFTRIGWPTLLILGGIVLFTWISDRLFSALATRKAGASWKTVLAAFVGGLIGGLVLTGVLPVVGTLIGAALGAFAGIVLAELLQQRPLDQAFRFGVGYCLGALAAALINLILCLAMLGIFVWQAFLAPSGA
ncbi:MAG: DUF456 domain-containing protein [Anaerolineae bacterium]|nr:DUF456 domain-containing protein [Thermoflexales bacterium]MDW8407111.1 DUF456 domain-containing protein [Anaerolineae bacterium]